MKKIISLCFATFLLSAVAIGQSADTNTNETKAKKECVPTKECAEKMGMTLAECKAVCAKKASKTASTDTKATAVLASMDAKEGESKAKSCSPSEIEACAKKMGITVEECKKRCESKAKTAETTKVASAVLVNEKPQEATKAACGKKEVKAACASKKENQ